LVAATARKKERIVGIVPAGEVFGLDCLFAGGVRTQSAVARQDSAACYITPCQLKNTLSTDVGLSWRILVSLAERVHALGEERLLFTGCRVPEQIVNLTRLCARHPDVAHLKQAELADWLGVSRETVCRELRSITTPKHASSRADEDWRN
jgi:CRP-like cAMP-binding protein